MKIMQRGYQGDPDKVVGEAKDKKEFYDFILYEVCGFSRDKQYYDNVDDQHIDEAFDEYYLTNEI